MEDRVRKPAAPSPGHRVSPGKRFFFARVFPGVFILMGGGILAWGVHTLVMAKASASWPTVEGRIISSSVEPRGSAGGDRTSYRVRVIYEYDVGASSFTGNRREFSGHASNDLADARSTAARYPAGAAVTVHYSPDDPADAVLEAGIQGVTWGPFVIGAIFFCVGVALFSCMPRLIDKGSIAIR